MNKTTDLLSNTIDFNEVGYRSKLHYLFIYFLVFNFSVLRGHSFFSSPPQQPMTSDFEGFLSQILSITLFSYLISGERASIFPFQC